MTINDKILQFLSENKISFTLHGNFTDQTFSEFSGLWTEEGELYEFEVIGIPSE